jgi:hypothetical protein
MTILAVSGLTSVIDWIVCGSVGAVATVVSVYRVTTRRFGLGPRDT